jgi:23S rRNA pseudouridine1911/1915/1917 synthase
LEQRGHQSQLSSLHIVGESDDWIVIDKPPLLSVHPTRPGDRRTLWEQLRELLAYEIAAGGQVSIINRLDRETSGLTLIAKTREAARFFHGEMEARRVAKEYFAIVWGWPAREEWRVDAPLLRQGARGPSRIHLKQAAHPDGAEARTRFRVERRFERATANGARFSIVRAFPETGRTHQIRVHLSLSGHPIVGDKIYGPDEGCYLEFIETGWTPALAARLLLRRHALHSAALRLDASNLEWRAPLAPDLAEFAGASRAF